MVILYHNIVYHINLKKSIANLKIYDIIFNKNYKFFIKIAFI